MANYTVEYRKLFMDMIASHIENIVLFSYDPVGKNHTYWPFRHASMVDAEDRLGTAMNNHLPFYAYSEQEVVELYNQGRLSDLKTAATRARNSRLPRREGPTSGLYGEVLLDLMIGIYCEEATRLALRTLFRQLTDNSEIKGFDGLHVVISGTGQKELWLSQSKMGSITYCIRGLAKDIQDKANMMYSSEQLYFVADKQFGVSSVALEVLRQINEISFLSEAPEERAKNMASLFRDQDIQITYSCLAAYGADDVYANSGTVDDAIQSHANRIIRTFDDKHLNLLSVPYRILIMFLPIRDINRVRSAMDA